jgi:hypothetical protein
LKRYSIPFTGLVEDPKLLMTADQSTVLSSKLLVLTTVEAFSVELLRRSFPDPGSASAVTDEKMYWIARGPG